MLRAWIELPATRPSPGPALAHRRRGRKRDRDRRDRRASGSGRNPDPRRLRHEPHAGHAFGGDERPCSHIPVGLGGHDVCDSGGAGARPDHVERWQLSAASGRWGRGRT